MTAHRRPSIRFSDAARGICRWCGKAILHESGEKKGELNRRRRWHPSCVDAYNASDPREARRLVRKRDRGICASCGLDTRKLARSVKGRGRTKKLRDLGFKPRRSLWELDHIMPLIDGGGHDLANLQTLCVPCHKTKSAAEAQGRAQLRRSDEAEASEASVEEAFAAAGEVNRRVEALLGRASESSRLR